MTRLAENRLDAATRCLGGLLAGLLLVFELLASDGQFHQAFHANSGKAASNNCLICLFAKAQVESANPAPVFLPPVHSAFALSQRIISIVLPDFTYLASSSRAPPVPGAFPAVAA